MDDDIERDDAKRKSRNLSEKKRRDQFNVLINELNSMVSSANRKLDKSTVLKATISFLKQHNDMTTRSRMHEIQENWKPSFLSNEEFTHLMLEALDGFIMVFSSNGQIYYASESITSLLGHLPSDLLNTSLFDLVYEKEHHDVRQMLSNPTAVIDPMRNDLTIENQVDLLCHLKKGGLEHKDEEVYELVQFIGYFRNDVEMDELLPSTSNMDYESKLLFVGVGRTQMPQLVREMTVVDSAKSEFTSRHSLEWKFIFLDHRATPIIGYLPFEVLGTSGYDYNHFDDLDSIVACHESVMEKGEGNSGYYRFLTKSQQWIWLQTRFYISYHQWNSKPEFVVCTHRVINYADVLKQVNNDRKEIVNENGKSKNKKKTDEMRSDDVRSDESKSCSVKLSHKHEMYGSESNNKDNKNDDCRSDHSRLEDKRSIENASKASSATIQSRYTSPSPILSAKSEPPRTFRSRMTESPNSSKHSLGHQSGIVKINNKKFKRSEKPSSPASGSQSSVPMEYTVTNKPDNVLQEMHFSQVETFDQEYPPTTYLQPQYDMVKSLQALSQPYSVPPQHLTTYPEQSVPPIQPSLDVLHRDLVMTSTQSHIQNQLQRKHEELQQLIIKQQKELQLVSEQLHLAQYGILPGVTTAHSPFANRQQVGKMDNIMSVHRSVVNVESTTIVKDSDEPTFSGSMHQSQIQSSHDFDNSAIQLNASPTSILDTAANAVDTLKYSSGND